MTTETDISEEVLLRAYYDRRTSTWPCYERAMQTPLLRRIIVMHARYGLTTIAQGQVQPNPNDRRSYRPLHQGFPSQAPALSQKSLASGEKPELDED